MTVLKGHPAHPNANLDIVVAAGIGLKWEPQINQYTQIRSVEQND
jgi:hypothetical protein